MSYTNNLRIKELKPIASPALILNQIPLSPTALAVVQRFRHEASLIIHGKDDRLLVIVGPCSIHDPKAALEYAHKLYKMAQKYQNALCIIMRVYFEKPRTTIGWKGLINDPHLDGSFDINHGLYLGRQLLSDINALGLPTGSEFLDTIIPQYISDLTSWSAIGARTSESQIHRELASGLSMPLGFKNGTTGSIKVAIEAVCAANHPHHFLGVSELGIAAIVSTTGNEDCHIILRGSLQGPNFAREHIQKATHSLKLAALTPKLMVDCSHGNSGKDYRKQKVVVQSLCEQISSGSQNIFGVMMESNLVAGQQDYQAEQPLVYGQSITDACIDLDETASLFDLLAEAVLARRKIGVYER